MGQAESLLNRHFIILSKDTPTTYREITASGEVTNIITPQIAHVIANIPTFLRKECFHGDNFNVESSIQTLSFLITDQHYQPIAFAAYGPETINGVRCFVIWNVCTAVKYRRQGIISKLLNYSFEYLKNINNVSNSQVGFISLYVLKNNLSAQKVYADLGFVDDPIYNADITMYRRVRPINYVPPTIPAISREHSSAFARELTNIHTLDPLKEAKLIFNFQNEYGARLLGLKNEPMVTRDMILHNIRRKYSDLSPTRLNEAISQLIEYLKPQMTESKELSDNTSNKIKEQFKGEYIKALENVYTYLSSHEQSPTNLEAYKPLNQALNDIITKYQSQVDEAEFKSSIQEVTSSLINSPRWHDQAPIIIKLQEKYDMDLIRDNMEVEKADPTIKALASTLQTPVVSTNFVGYVEQQLIGLAYLANKYRKNTCVYRPPIIISTGNAGISRAKFGVIILCDGTNFYMDGPSDLNEQLERCSKPFFVISLYIGKISSINDTNNITEGHMNMLIFDVAAKVVERFEPHGTSSYTPNELKTNTVHCNEGTKVDQVIRQWLSQSTTIIYVPPIEFCPSVQLSQQLENEMTAFDPEGFCLAWSLWYVDIRLANPEKSRKAVIAEAISFLKRLGSLTAFIRNYADHVDKLVIRVRDMVNRSPMAITPLDWITANWDHLISG